MTSVKYEILSLILQGKLAELSLQKLQFFDHPTTMANITGDGNFTTKLNSVFMDLPVGIADFFSALNIFLSITSCLGNTFILIALHNVSIHPPTKLFFRCLAVTDLCIALIVQPLYVTFLLFHKTEVMSENTVYYVSESFNAFGWILCGVSLLTSTAISVDRLLALLLGLRYRHVVTLRRVRVVIIFFWLISALFVSIRMSGSDAFFILASIMVPLSVVTSIFCYTRIYLRVRHQQAQVHSHVSQGRASGGRIPLKMARYKKSVSSISWVQLGLLACYAPFCIVLALYVCDGIENDVAWVATLTLIYLNSSLNPILYCWKIGEVRQAVKDTLRQLLSLIH